MISDHQYYMHTGLSSFFRLPKNNLNQTFDSDWPLGFCPRTFEWVSKETAFYFNGFRDPRETF